MNTHTRAQSTRDMGWADKAEGAWALEADRPGFETGLCSLPRGLASPGLRDRAISRPSFLGRQELWERIHLRCWEQMPFHIRSFPQASPGLSLLTC